MHCKSRSILARLTIVGALLLVASEARAQGVTGSALTGTVQDPDGAPVPSAKVQLRNTGTGDTYDSVTGATGQYFLDNVVPGGPYTLTINAEGYEPKSREGIRLALGQRLVLDVPIKYFGELVVIESHSDSLDDHNRTGNSTTVKEQQIAKLPLQGRNFTDLIRTAPGVVGSSFAGQNNRYNNIQIDGGANNDLFGLSGNGTPGGQSGAKPLSIEAVQEFQVQVAPFDVRQGSFAGGLVNAITKSGTNDLHGSLFGYYQGKSLAGRRSDPTFLGYNTYQFGGSASGPILKDKAHFFIATDLQQNDQSFGNQYQIGGVDPAADLLTAGFNTATVDRFNSILSSKYGINNAGSALSPSIANPDRNLFVKLTTSAIENSHLELSYNLVHATSDQLSRDPTTVAPPFSLSGGYELSNSGYVQANTTNTVRAKLTTNFGDGAFSNEFLTGLSIIRDARQLPQNLPLILVKVGTVNNADSYLAAGGERFSQMNTLDQNIYQLQDNVTYATGHHRLTLGSSNEFLHLKNVFLQAATGVYSFDSLDAFQAGTPSAFERRISVSNLQDPGTAAFNVSQFGFYLQDEWSPRENLTLQPGLRVDIPFLSHANTNPALVNNAAFPIDTSKVPTGSFLWSPRFGFNWDVTGASDTIVRGGAGIFAGRPPYVWISNAYSINGLSQYDLLCSGKTIPNFNPDPNAQPTDCTGGQGAPATPANVGEIDYFDPNTKFPQNGRLALGVDQRLPFGVVGSADFLYTRDVNGWYTLDSNLQSTGVNGEGRTTYGTVGSTTTKPFAATPSRIDPAHLGSAVEVVNKNGGYVYSSTLQLQKQFVQQYSVTVGYTFSRSYDRMSLTSSQAFSNYRFSPLDGDLSNRNVRPSAFDRPHKITVTGTAALPYGFGVGATYIGLSGSPYTYTVTGDINGDGVSGNDTPYIPTSAADISLKDPTQYAALSAFIDSQGCLASARGTILQRSACRNPWSNLLDTRLTWTSPAFKGQRIEAQFDIFNLMNLIHSDWGHFDQVTPFESGPRLLRAVGYDKVNNRPVYSFADPSPVVNTLYTPTSSRWRMQFGARYIF